LYDRMFLWRGDRQREIEAKRAIYLLYECDCMFLCNFHVSEKRPN
jgi:hypothetical protein